MGVGVNSWMIVPPKQKDWITVGYCMHQCTEVTLEMIIPLVFKDLYPKILIN